MYFETVTTTVTPTQANKRLKILTQLVLTGFTVVACLGAFHHLNLQTHGGSAHAAAARTASLESYHASRLRKSRAQIRVLAKTIYKKPKAIKGQAIANLVQIFYQPELTRTEGTMVLWQYRNAECVLDVYFKTKGSMSGLEKVHYFETRFRDPSRNAPHNDSKACVHSLLKTSSAPRMVDVSSIFKL